MHVQNGRYQAGIWNTCNGVKESYHSSGSTDRPDKMPGILKTKSHDVYAEMLYASESSKLEMTGGRKMAAKSSLKSSSLKSLRVEHAVVEAPATNYIRNSYSASNLTMYAQLEDLIHLKGPLTEDAILKTLQARFYNSNYYTWIGGILVAVNPHTCTPPPRALSDDRRPCRHVTRMVKQATQAQLETAQSQVIMLNGMSGSGKTFLLTQLLRQLFDVAGGGPETDAFKHLRAAFTVLQSLGSASTAANPESSRMGYFFESHIADGAIYRTKIHCYFLDQTRIVRPPGGEKNYHVFYQILAGLSQEEKGKFHLLGVTPLNLRYLSGGNFLQNETQDRHRFEAWKNALSVLGIPFSDVIRVMAAILLLGNIQFVEGPGLELDVRGNNEMRSVAALLGISVVSLYRGLTTRTRKTRGQVFKSLADPITANESRDALAKALYSRSVAAIVKRANNCKRPPPTTNASSTISADNSSNDSSNPDALHMNGEGNVGSKSSPSRSAVPSFVGVLDMFGFEDTQHNQLEQLCINLCAENMQHFYNTHVFATAHEASIQEEILSEMDINYFDNAPIIDLMSSQRLGILGMLDSECALQKGSTETYLQKVHTQHKMNKHFFESLSADCQQFGIIHFGGKVLYNVRDFLGGNRDLCPDDVISIFSRHNCNFGFVSHLFNSELKTLQDNGDGCRGYQYRISPSVVPVDGVSDFRGTLCQDFHARLHGLLQMLSYSKPHFVRCLKSNAIGQRELFERETVMRQIRSMQILETTHLMAAGFPHRFRYRAFNLRYRPLLAKSKHNLPHNTDKAFDEFKLILDHLQRVLDESKEVYSNVHWAVGKKNIFLSEAAMQQLEYLRQGCRHIAAVTIQANWRRRLCAKKWPMLKRQLQLRQRERERSPRGRHTHTRRNSLPTGNGFYGRTMSLDRNVDRSMSLDRSTQRPSSLDRMSSRPMSAGQNRDRHFSSSLDHASSQTMSAGQNTDRHVSPSMDGTSGRTISAGQNTDRHVSPSMDRTSGWTISAGQNPDRHVSPSMDRTSGWTISAGQNPDRHVLTEARNGDMTKCDQNVLDKTYNIYGLDMDAPPPVPTNRTYTVAGNVRMGFPQFRVMKQNYTVENAPGNEVLLRGQEIKVIGSSPKRGYLIAEYKNTTVHVPFKLTELRGAAARRNSSSHLPGIDV